jgi:hypothetical protein
VLLLHCKKPFPATHEPPLCTPPAPVWTPHRSNYSILISPCSGPLDCCSLPALPPSPDTATPPLAHLKLLLVCVDARAAPAWPCALRDQPLLHLAQLARHLSTNSGAVQHASAATHTSIHANTQPSSMCTKAWCRLHIHRVYAALCCVQCVLPAPLIYHRALSEQDSTTAAAAGIAATSTVPKTPASAAVRAAGA